jgi:hypothetical protein
MFQQIVMPSSEGYYYKLHKMCIKWKLQNGKTLFYHFVILMRNYVLFSINSLRITFFGGAAASCVTGPPHYPDFKIALRHTTHDRTPLDEWSPRSSDLYLTTHNTHKSKTSMHTEGFEPAIPESGRPQTHALDCAATGTVLGV